MFVSFSKGYVAYSAAPAHRLAIKTVKWCSTPKLVNV